MQRRRPAARRLHPRGRDRSGHTLVIDEPADRGGADLGPSPTRAAAAGLAACTAITCEMYAARKGWELGAVECEVEVEQGRGAVLRARSTLTPPDPRAARRRAARAAAGDRRQVPGPPGADRRVRDRDPRPDRARLSADGPRPRGPRVRGHRREPRDRPRDGAHALRRGRLGAAGRARRRTASPTRPPSACREVATAGARAETWRSTSPMPTPASGSSRLRARFGGLDVLVNNAGAARWRDLDDVPEEDWYAAWELNVMAPMRLMRAAVAGDGRTRLGPVVNVSSTAGKRPSPQMGEYSVAKAAQLSLSRLYADRYAEAGVLVNAICPGPTKSEMWMADGRPARSVARARRARHPRAGARGGRRASGRSAAWPRSRRSPRRSSSSAPSAPPTSPAPPGGSTAAPCR